jgi:hypothetical protein
MAAASSSSSLPAEVVSDVAPDVAPAAALGATVALGAVPPQPSSRAQIESAAPVILQRIAHLRYVGAGYGCESTLLAAVHSRDAGSVAG